jgi:hypothetical protein
MIVRPRAFRPGRLLLGALVVGAYLAGAVVSGRLSPLARHPLLDGFQTPQAYRWVNPPPDQAGTNKPPGSADKTLSFANQGASGFVPTTDGQALLIIGKGTFRVPEAAGQAAVRMTIDPLDAATLGALPSPLAPNGNAYRIEAAFRPSGDKLTTFTAPVTLTLVYPAVATRGLRPPVHTILWSKDGRTWTTIRTQDSHQGLQTAGTIEAPGYVVVGSAPQSGAAGSSSHLRLLAVGILVALALFVLAGVLHLLRARGRGEDA